MTKAVGEGPEVKFVGDEYACHDKALDPAEVELEFVNDDGVGFSDPDCKRDEIERITLLIYSIPSITQGFPEKKTEQGF